MEAVIIGMSTGIISGFLSGFLVYFITKKKEQNQYIYRYWMDFLYKAMEHVEIYIPSEQLRYILKIDKEGSDWYTSIQAILDALNPFDMNNRVFSESETNLANNILVALKELNAWAKRNHIKNM